MKVKFEHLEFDWKIVAKNDSIRGIRYYLLGDKEAGLFRGIKQNTNPNDKAFRGKVTEWYDTRGKIVRIDDTCFVHGEELDIFNKKGFVLEPVMVTDGSTTMNLCRLKQEAEPEKKVKSEIGVRPAEHISTKTNPK
jgi:hypothetical protein